MSRKIESTEYANGQRIAFIDPEAKIKSVLAHLPETFNFGVGSRYTDPFSRFGINGDLGAILTDTTGINLNTSLATQKVYSGPLCRDSNSII